ncbi:ABC transporter substrate-binding protein [Parafrankia sp. FMc2]|uniref:ABC transporter substrate-binding protein n=1 Tax=Parafrankia sp. FMc2 TaxID=3233196 RepID=UPI0034D7376B
MRSPRRRRPLLIAAAVAALAISACSVESKDDTPSASGGPTAEAYPPPAAPAVAPGVTANSIKIGFVYPDLDKVRQYIQIDHGDYKAAFQALVDKANSEGGINGRKIIPVYGAVDVISPTGAQETCVRLTEDEKVFAVLGSLNADEALCYVQTHKTAVVGGDLTAARYALAQAPWIATLQGGDEIADGLPLLADRGALTGKKLAVVSYKDDQALLDTTVLPTLRGRNIAITETAVMDADIKDPAAVSSQLNVFIQKFQSDGVNAVLLIAGAQSQFPAELAKTSYRPQLLFQSNNQAGAFIFGASDDDLKVLDGALSLGQAVDYTPRDNPCIATVEAAVPAARGKIINPGDVPKGQPQIAISEGIACQTLALFRAVVQKAGKNLTYQSFQQAAFSLGKINLPIVVDDATYGRQTPHGDIPPRVMTYDPVKKTFELAAG